MITAFWKGAIIWGIIGLIIGLLIGMAIGWRMDNNLLQPGSDATTLPGLTGTTATSTVTTGNPSTTTITTSTASTTGATATPSSDSATSVSVSDQPAGMAVTVASVTMPVTGWVAVHEVSADGVIGNVLGAARRDQGTSTGVIVDLLRGTVPNGKYAVILYADNGNGQYDVNADAPILGSDGKPIIEEFTATTPVAPAGQ